MRAEHWWYTLPLRLRSLFRRASVERELDEELRFHADALTAQYVARGMAPGAARTEALRALGGVERRKEEMREARQVGRIEDLFRDLRHAVRTLGRTPGYTLVAILTLAVGIGANTAIFTVVNAVLLRPLEYANPDRLAVLQFRNQETVTPGAFLHWHDAATRSFAQIGAAQSGSPTMTGRGAPQQVRGLRLTADVIPLLGVKPLLGRSMLPTETHAGRDQVVVLSYPFWQRLGGDPALVGQHLVLDGVTTEVIGVMPKNFQFAPFWSTHAEVFRPLVLDGQENNFDGASLRVFARLRPGVTTAQAQAEASAIVAPLKASFPEVNPDAVTMSLQEKVVGSVQGTLWLLLAAVGLVLLIACANVAHLQLIRAGARERETAMRLSLGASRGRLLQQSLTESVVVALMGGVAGLALAVTAVHAMVALAPPGIPRLDAIGIDPGVFLFMLGVALLGGLISGALPALAVSRVDPNHVLKDSGRGSGQSRQRRRASNLLVVSEFAMAVILLVGAGLVLRSVGAMLRVDPGFNPRHVLSLQVAVRGTQHEAPSRRGPFYREVLDRLRALPGVEAASGINHLPLHGDAWRFTFNIDGHPVAREEDQAHALFRVVQPGYFGTMGIRLVRGRDITGDDVANRAHVVILDESAARRYWPGGDALGQRISVNGPNDPPEWFTVVGIVGDVRQPEWNGTHDGEMYYPYWDASPGEPAGGFTAQLHPNYFTMVIRTEGAPDAVARQVSTLVQSLDADAPVSDVITMDQALAEQVAPDRFYLLLLGSFAGAALLLAAIGVYGVISYSVAMRSRDIGIRLALGADLREPFRLVVGEGVRLAVGGAVIGLVGALVLTRYLRSLLYAVQPIDPLTFFVVPVILIGIATVACYLPARRAGRVDPAVALRGE